MIRLRPHALLLLAEALITRPDAVLVYSDEDRLDAGGRRRDHWFKPDWNPSLLLSTNFVGGLAALPLQRVRELGGIGARGSWGLYLRLTHDVDPARVVHVPHVLVHRKLGDTAAAAPSPDAVQAYLESAGVDAAVEPVGTVGVRVVRRLPTPAPPVRLVVATGCLHDRVGSCLESVLQKTDYPDLRLSLVVDDRMEDDPGKRPVVERLTADERVDVLRYPYRSFSYAWVHNWAVSQVEEELLCLLNDDIWVIEPRWLELMIGHVLQPSVGAVGARLLYPDGTVQHGGVILGTAGVAGHYHHGLHRASGGYHGRAVLDQDLSCVTAACMALRRDTYEMVGGFDEGLAIAFNDVDLCIKLRGAGWRIVLAAGAELVHRESTSLGPPDAPARRERFAEECQRMEARWGATERDPAQSEPRPRCPRSPRLPPARLVPVALIGRDGSQSGPAPRRRASSAPARKGAVRRHDQESFIVAMTAAASSACSALREALASCIRATPRKWRSSFSSLPSRPMSTMRSPSTSKSTLTLSGCSRAVSTNSRTSDSACEPTTRMPRPCPWGNSKLGYSPSISCHNRQTPKSASRSLVS